MGLINHPEIKITRKILALHKLTVPFDLDELVSKYAEVIYKTIPISGVDGICMNLKCPGKKTKVIVNTSTSVNRQRFTLAHELGHIIIPWHLGTIIDDLNINKTNSKYWNLETEANRFASELLMPFEWIYRKVEEHGFKFDLILSLIKNECKVSEEAVKIRLKRFWYELMDYEIPKKNVIQLYASYDIAHLHEILTNNTRYYPHDIASHIVQHLENKVAFVSEKDGIVITGGHSPRTREMIQYQGQEFNDNPYPFYKNYKVYNNEYSNTHWWELDFELNQIDDNRAWREILEDIISNIYKEDKIKSKRASINGRISGIHGSYKSKRTNYDIEEFITDIRASFNNVMDREFILHPDFNSFVSKRCTELFHSKK